MKRDVVCDEAELAITANQIVDFTEFLDESITAYTKILATLQEKGIKDDLVCAKLSELAADVEPVKKVLAEACQEITHLIRQYIDEIASADSFQFSSDLQGTVLAVLSKLL